MNGANTSTQGSVAGDELKLREQEFHDGWAASLSPGEVLVDESWEAVTCPEHRWIRSQIGDSRGKRVLDLGCGAGEAAVWFAKQGADVVASDLSPQFLDLVERVARLHGTTVHTHLADADRFDLPPASFDLVYAGNVLHHVDLDKTLEQIHRVLKPGGKLFTWDPLRHNPVINVYRRMAAGVRTEDEHPFHIRDVKRYERYFVDVRYQCFWCFTLWLFVRFFVIEGVHPSKERYWKKIIREHERLTPRYQRLEWLDRQVLRWMPFLKRYCWNVAVSATKRIS
jgi:SAM-dependent methyltransferase